MAVFNPMFMLNNGFRFARSRRSNSPYSIAVVVIMLLMPPCMS